MLANQQHLRVAFVRRANAKTGSQVQRFVQLSTKLIRNEWIEPEIQKYLNLDALRSQLDRFARGEGYHLEEIFERIVWPIQKANIEFIDIIFGDVELNPHSLMTDGEMCWRKI